MSLNSVKASKRCPVRVGPLKRRSTNVDLAMTVGRIAVVYHLQVLITNGKLDIVGDGLTWGRP